MAPRTVTKWRQAKYMPEINERRVIQIFNAINNLCEQKDIPYRKIKLGDLLEFFNEELREFDVNDYGYVSGDARKKPLKQKDKDAPVSPDGKIAA